MIISQDHGRRPPSVLLSVIRQDFYAKPVAWRQPSSPDSCTESTAELFVLEQAMIPQQTMMQDAQINYLSTLSIFMKQRTYLATLPNPNLKANECHCF
jgi:hypothetical protein